MKKSFLSLGLLATLALSANAQDVATGSEFKPTAGNITVELNMSSPFATGNPFGFGTSNYFGTGAQSAVPALRFRYFLSDGLAFRLNFAIVANRYKQDFGNTSTDNYTAVPNTGSGTATPATFKVTSSNTLVNISPGLEIHKDVSERLSVYYGAFIDFATQSAKGKVEGTTGTFNESDIIGGAATTSNVTTGGSYSYEVKGASFGNINNLASPLNNSVSTDNPWSVDGSGVITGPRFGSAANTPDGIRNAASRGFTRIGLVGVIGADYYITKALYLGVETGWGFATTSFKKITVKENATEISRTTVATGGSSVTPANPATSSRQVVENKDSQLQFTPVVNAAFRFGFWF